MTDQPATEDPILALEAAIESFVAATSDHAVLVTGAVVVWETACFHEGQAVPMRQIDYAVASSSTSMGAGIGLAAAASKMMLRDFTEEDVTIVFEEGEESPGDG